MKVEGYKNINWNFIDCRQVIDDDDVIRISAQVHKSGGPGLRRVYSRADGAVLMEYHERQGAEVGLTIYYLFKRA